MRALELDRLRRALRLDRVLTPALRFIAGRAPLAFRTSEFDLLAPRSDYGAVTCGSESFIVHSSDRIIARILWREGNRFLDRLSRVLEALGPALKLDTLVEVGANIGIVCIPAVNRGLARRAIAIEPVPSNYHLLRANIVLNGVEDRITTHPLALGAETNTTVVFELSPDNSGDHRVRRGSGEGLFSEPTRKAIEIASTRYDDVVPALDPATTLLWLEAQGVEGLILQGAAKVVEARVPVLIEFAPYLIERSGSREALERAALQYGRCLDVFRQNAAPEAMSKAVLQETWDRLGTRGAYTDLLLY